MPASRCSTYEGLWRQMTKRMGLHGRPWITRTSLSTTTTSRPGWWILKEVLRRQALDIRRTQILPYCPRCGTGLASHEVAQGYKDGQGKHCNCKVQEEGHRQTNTSSHGRLHRGRSLRTLRLTVGPDVDYIKVKLTAGDEEGNVYVSCKGSLRTKHLGEGEYD